jgi:hypothetical protein
MLKFIFAAMMAALTQGAYASDTAEAKSTIVETTSKATGQKTCWREQHFEPVEPRYGDVWTINNNGSVGLTRIPCLPASEVPPKK